MRLFEKGKVSIITPCYNGERFLDRYFDSICKQTYDKIELIFVNDERSNDNLKKSVFPGNQKLRNGDIDFGMFHKKNSQVGMRVRSMKDYRM